MINVDTSWQESVIERICERLYMLCSNMEEVRSVVCVSRCECVHVDWHRSRYCVYTLPVLQEV
jgi:hypothetical protein